MQINKSDRNDAVGIARIMQCGWYKEVRVKDLDCHAIKALLHQPGSVRQDQAGFSSIAKQGAISPPPPSRQDSSPAALAGTR